MQAIAGLCLTLSAKSSLRFKFSAMTALATLLTGAVGRYRHELASIVYLVEQFHEYRPLPKLSKSGQHHSDLSCKLSTDVLDICVACSITCEKIYNKSLHAGSQPSRICHDWRYDIHEA